MALAECTNCRLPLAEGDGFCGNCGTRATPAEDHTTVGAGAGRWPGTGAGSYAQPDGGTRTPTARPFEPGNGHAQPDNTQRRETGAALSDRFFRHSSRRPDKPLTNATRYLCAAAYLDSLFANAVIWELLASRRAVAPSIGIDLGPIIRHCLNARRLQLIRDVILAILLLIGIVVATLPTLIVLIIGAALTFLPGGTERRSLGTKLLAGAAIGIMLAVAGAAIGITIVVSLASQNSVPVGLLGEGDAPAGDLTVAFALLTGTTVFVYTNARFRILGARLGPARSRSNSRRRLPESSHASPRSSQPSGAMSRSMRRMPSSERPEYPTWSIAIEWTGQAAAACPRLDAAEVARLRADRSSRTARRDPETTAEAQGFRAAAETSGYLPSRSRITSSEKASVAGTGRWWIQRGTCPTRRPATARSRR